MMRLIVLAAALPTMEDVIRGLAMVGGAALGAFVTGFLTQVIIKGYTGQQVPRPVVWTLRVLGGVAMGWLVYLVAFGPGGGMFGGLGWFGGGAGTGTANTSPGTTPSTTKDGATHTSEPADRARTLRIQILGDPALGRLAQAGLIKAVQPEQCYRILDDDPERLRTLDDVKKYILQRLKRQPPVKRIELLLYKDSPQRRVPRVASLKDWTDLLQTEGSDERIVVDFKEPGEVAPLHGS